MSHPVGDSTVGGPPRGLGRRVSIIRSSVDPPRGNPHEVALGDDRYQNSLGMNLRVRARYEG